MKKLITTPEQMTTVQLDHLRGNEIIAYRCKSKTEVYRILSPLIPLISAEAARGGSRYGSFTAIAEVGPKYGFVYMGGSGTMPSYIENTWIASIEAALKAPRQLFVFASQDELLQAILHRKF
jgi:hypothetical protein